MINDGTYHILTLVIHKSEDIPRVRSKVKLLIRAIGGTVGLVTGIAVGASEIARFLLQRHGGGKVRVSLYPLSNSSGSGVELLFNSNLGCVQGDICPLDRKTLMAQPPFPGLAKVFSAVQTDGGFMGKSLTVLCNNKNQDIAWESVNGRLAAIRRELFIDTEESYVENLRAKHDEVTRLLRDKTEQNLMLDQSNNELLQLTNDLEELARERTIIEMSLRIADRIRNPATVIGGMARILQEKGKFSTGENKKISLIAAEAEKIEGIVKQFNLMAGQRRVRFARENIADLLRDSVESCPTVRQRHIRVQVDAPDTAVAVQANRRLLKIAVMHFLRYLIISSPAAKNLDIVAEEGKDVAVSFYLEVSDSPDLVVTAGNVMEEKDKGLELVRQILAEHQADLLFFKKKGGPVAVVRFPVVLHEQPMEPIAEPAEE